LTVLRGARVVLRPLRADEFESLSQAPGRVAPDDEWLRRRIERSGRLIDGWLDLGIEAGARLVGDIGARQPSGALPPGVFELGLSIFLEEDRGQGYGREAVELLTRHLFEEHGAGRVQVTTAVGNAAMRRVLERLGFVYEGTLRAYMPADGSREDYVLYALTRSEWQAFVS
jgi:RimJ/RimL family protein N-acetyltransferase